MAEAQLSMSSFKKQLDDQLTCSVCLEQYTNPKTLPCHHSFCLECIQQLPVVIKDSKYYISCPTCRVDHLIPQGGVVDYPNAFHINSLLDLRKTYEKGIGLITTPPSAKQPSTLTLQSHDDSPLSSSTLSSQRKSSTTPTSTQQQLMGPVGCAASPFTLPGVIHLPEIRGKTVRIKTSATRPKGIVVSDNGNIVVAEASTHCITIFNKEVKKMITFGRKGTGKGQFIYPSGVAVTIDGYLLVTDNHRLQKLTTDGVCVKSVGSSSSGSGRLHFKYPQGIAVHPTTGQIFVADSGNNRIQVFTNDLKFSHTIAVRGGKHFKNPCDVALDSEGDLYLAESDNHCITIVTTTGQYVTRFGSKGSAPGQLHNPSSITIGNNLVYVSESGNSRVSIFNTNGKFLHCFGKYGKSEGEFNEPCGIAMDTSGNLYVSDTWNNRIVVC